MAKQTQKEYLEKLLVLVQKKRAVSETDYWYYKELEVKRQLNDMEFEEMQREVANSE